MRGRVDGGAQRRWDEDEAGLACNLLGDAVLEGEDVGGRTFKGLGPEVAVGAGVDELGGDADPVAGADDGAFDDGVDVELASNVGEWAMRALVGHDGGSGDDAKVGDTGELSDELVGHAVGEVLLAWVAGEVLKRKNGNRADGGATVSMEEPGSQRMGAEGEDRYGDEDGGAQGPDQPKLAARFNGRSDGGRCRGLRRNRDLQRSRNLDWKIGSLGWFGDLRLNRRNGCDEPVTRSGDCLDELRPVWAVAKSLANFTDCRVDSEFDIDKDFLLPEAARRSPPD